MADLQTSLQIGGGRQFEVAFMNNTGADIPSGSAVVLDTTNVLGGTALTPYAVSCMLPASAGGAQGGGIGITMFDTPAGASGLVRVYGTAVGVSDGAITAGARVRASDTALKMGRVKACAAGEAQFGIALNTTVDADPVLVLFRGGFNA